ncbi:uncharacterized protein M421DRAFT_405305 [Didymella exigua CBS 183.55]|uniref:Uncharacterized protein n=1 Tax=Didymella exigua CBS 183.55 TaxID=1150837 RepID=A0A6A5R7R9_9PLEO|nr:uncharacterized protein M421DRAFT_405305 [Didymella exigua CBS 183.55]KAF1923683.1 hypothetical protein M421DRAFT_405305 [Didymella exigua CBS 183.55]
MAKRCGRSMCRWSHFTRSPVHNDDDEITTSSLPFRELIPNWTTLEPKWKNPATCNKFASAHHGSSGGKKLSDFKTFHLACCLEFINKTVGGVNHLVRCMNVFAVDFNQCCVHTKAMYKDGPNRIYTLMKRKETANWGMIKDTNVQQQPKPIVEWQLGDLNREAAAAKIEEAIASGLDTSAVWGSINAALDTQTRIAKKLEIAQTRDAATRRKATLTEKSKNPNVDRRKTDYRLLWGSSKLNAVS